MRWLLVALLSSCAAKQPEKFDKKILVVIRGQQNYSSVVGSIIQPVFHLILP